MTNVTKMQAKKELNPGFVVIITNRKNGICVECKTGYASKDGLPCLPCVDGEWGRKCRFTCNCQDHEKCDLVYGCVERTMIMSESWRRTTSTGLTYDITTANSISQTETNDGILLKRDIIVSLISVGSIAVIVTVASCCFKYHRKAENLCKSRSETIHRDNKSIERKQDNKNNGSVYDLINYDAINDDSLIRIVASVPMEHYSQA